VLTMIGLNLMNQFSEKLFKSFLKTSQELIQAFEDDNFVQVLRHQAGIIRSDITYTDSEGKEQIDTQLLSKLQGVLLPVLADALKYIPIPRIASSNSNQEFWLDNIVLCIYDLLPENIYFHIESDSRFSLKDLEIKASQTHLIINLDRIITELKDMEFYFKTKKWPGVSDRGRVSVRIFGQGARLKLIFRIVQDKHDNVPRLSHGSVQFKIREMEMKLDKSTLKHDVLLPMVKKLFRRTIQHKVEKEIESSLASLIQKLADNLSFILLNMNKKMAPQLESAREIVKNSQMVQVFERRRELIE